MLNILTSSTKKEMPSYNTKSKYVCAGRSKEVYTTARTKNVCPAILSECVCAGSTKCVFVPGLRMCLCNKY